MRVNCPNFTYRPCIITLGNNGWSIQRGSQSNNERVKQNTKVSGTSRGHCAQLTAPLSPWS